MTKKFALLCCSASGVVETTLTKTIDASDGNTYEINVTYKNSSGIPMEGTELLVAELLPGNEKYDEYLAASAAKVGTKAENIELSRVFDIRIVDENDNSRVYEPVGDVEVTIRLVGETLGDYANLDVLHFVEDKNAEGFTVYDMDSTVDGETVQFTTDSFSVYVVAGYVLETVIEATDGNTYRIAMTFTENALLPDDAHLAVTEMTGDALADYLGRTAATLEVGGFDYGRVFDIAIADGAGNLHQPQVPVQISVSLLDTGDSGGAFSVVHFAHGEAEAEIPEPVAAETDGNVVSFAAVSFSAYAIVQGPSEIPIGWTKLTSMDALTGVMNEGIYIGHTDGYYLTDTEDVASNGAHGIIKTKPAQSFPSPAAVKYYMEAVEETTNQYYLYCLKEGGRYYIYNSPDEHLYLKAEDATEKTAFTITAESNGRFSFRSVDTNRYLNHWQDANGTVFACWKDKNNGSYFYLWHNDGYTGNEDPYALGEKTYGLMYWNDSIYGKAMMSSAGVNSSLQAKELIVLSKQNNNTDKLFVPNDSDISMWTFQWIEGNLYYLKSTVNGSEKYLSIGSNGALTLSDYLTDDCKIQVIPGSGVNAGKICLKANGKTLTYSGTLTNGFKTGGTAGTEWLYLVEPSELTTEYLMPYSANKVSVSDGSVTNGSRIVLYTRVWNDTTKKYEFYVVDYDGSLVRAYESGDDIQWLGGLLNTKLWNFVEYYWEGTSDPNDYYELYNQYSEKYLAPQITGGQILSSGTIGINLIGRRDGSYQSTILAWDEKSYAYAGLKVENGQLVPCPKSEAMDFYFAVVQDLSVDDVLTTVSTVDHTQYGITMKIKDFGTRKEMSDFLGNDKYTNGNATERLLSTNLTDGYPTASEGSLAQMFSETREVNHLFIGSTHSATGYFEFNSMQNYAYLDGSDFTVYSQIGTHDNTNNIWEKHSQFLPYNKIAAGKYASVNRQNLYSAAGQPLSENDPRKYERLYLAQGAPNFYYGVELEASFTQTPSGLDAWGHDIIYEFTGDDDFWLYVDGELILDLGGIHDALPGSVNFRTGAVNVNGTSTTLKDLFYNNYLDRDGHTVEEAEAYVNGIFEKNSQDQWVFKDYSTHTMKIFYMERGGGAANLHMRFNLASVKPGTVELTKELEGIDKSVPVLAEFPYQIWYTLPGEEEDQQPVEYPLAPNNGEGITVRYKGTIRDVTYQESVTIDGVAYEHVFMIKPGETVVINLPDNTIDYKIVECGVNPEVYSTVTVNGMLNEGTNAKEGSSRKDYAIDYDEARDRPTVKYVNTVNPQALRTLSVTKQLYREDGTSALQYTDDETTFSLRLYLGTEFESDPDTANMYAYHIKDPNGYYCTWNTATQKVVSTEWNSLTSLTEAELASLTFNTSIYGSIAKIPAFYTVEVPNLLAGMTFRVQERPYEIPDGYSFQKYIYGTDSRENAMEGITDTVKANVDPHVDVCNLRGWGLRVNKVWSDASYMTSRDAAYFAVFTIDGQENLTIVPSTVIVKDENDDPTTIVRQLPYGETSVYWYFPQLPVAAATSLENYVIREVKLSGTLNTDYTVDPAGNVTLSNGTTVTSAAEGDFLTFSGMQNGESVNGSYEYTILYQEGTIPDDSHVRVDKVGNNRPGILLKKTDWDGNPLKGATFELKKDGTVLGTFVSAEDGVITTAFLSNDGATYTLTETSSPQGYQAIPTAITLSQTAGTVTVTGPDNAYYTLEQNLGVEASLTIKNRPYTFKAIKKDADTSNPISGAVFSLHKQVTVNGVTSYDLNPLTGYEDLTTGDDGVIPKLDETLPAGTYELREKVTPSGYQPLSGHIYFTVSSTGEILLVQHPEAFLDSSVDSGTGNIAYTITVTNRSKAKLTLTKQVTGDMGDKSSTNQFEFKLESVAGEVNGTTYAYTKSSTSSGTLTTTSGSNTFTLAHGESIEIELPLNKAVVITETNGNYTTAWSKENNTAATLTNESTASVTVTLSGDATVTVTNTLNAVAPAGVNLRVAPFAVMLIVGVFLAAVAIRGSKRKKKDGNKEF